MRLTYDDEADTLYVSLRERVKVEHPIIVDDDRTVDLATDGRPVGIEVLGASRGVRVVDLIERFDLGAFRENLERLEESRFRAVPSPQPT